LPRPRGSADRSAWAAVTPAAWRSAACAASEASCGVELLACDGVARDKFLCAHQVAIRLVGLRLRPPGGLRDSDLRVRGLTADPDADACACAPPALRERSPRLPALQKRAGGLRFRVYAQRVPARREPKDLPYPAGIDRPPHQLVVVHQYALTSRERAP
jgi:hypothetical protein